MPSSSPAPYDKSVFINCPYDTAFEPTMDAIVLATICSGFTPRSALETGRDAALRMERIAQAIATSKYSIHDLSRCYGEGDLRLARFNMPLELGMAVAHRFLARQESKRHEWLALVPEGYLHARFVSDLSGYDPPQYDGTPGSVVPFVVSWLATRPGAPPPLPPVEVLRALPRFAEERTRLGSQGWEGPALWSRLVEAGRRISVEL